MGLLIDQFLKKVGGQRENKKLPLSEIESISNETALQLRGGDKDYSPTYDHTLVNKNEQFSNPSILLDL